MERKRRYNVAEIWKYLDRIAPAKCSDASREVQRYMVSYWCWLLDGAQGELPAIGGLSFHGAAACRSELDRLLVI